MRRRHDGSPFVELARSGAAHLRPIIPARLGGYTGDTDVRQRRDRSSRRRSRMPAQPCPGLSMSRRPGRARRPKGSTAGCSTISAASIRLPPTSRGSARQGGHLATRRWYYLIPADRRAARAGSRHRIAHARPPARDRPSATPDASSSRPGSAGCSRDSAGWRWNIRPSCAIPYIARVDAGTDRAHSPARRRRRVVRRSGPAFLGGLERGGDRDAPRGVRQAPPHQGSAFEAIAARTRDGAADDGVRHPAADGRLVRGRRARQRLRARSCRPAKTPATRTICRRRGVSRAIGADELVLLDLWGKLEQPGAVFADITWVGFTGRDGAGALRRGRSRRSRRRGTPPSRSCRGASGPDATCAAGKSTVPASTVLRGRRLRRPDPAPHGPQPRRVGARQRREHGRLRNARRSAAARRAPALRSSPASTFRTSAFARKST